MTQEADGSYFGPKHLKQTTLHYSQFIENSQAKLGQHYLALYVSELPIKSECAWGVIPLTSSNQSPSVILHLLTEEVISSNNDELSGQVMNGLYDVCWLQVTGFPSVNVDDLRKTNLGK